MTQVENMTRLEAIKAALRGLDPNGFVEDMAWLLAQVEALAGALREGLQRHEEFACEHGLDTSRYPDAYIHTIRAALAALEEKG